ncbi:MAG: sugar phosphate isomerase/epimerase [Clostridia bacterium]|nr:sugar phosphate isomerase/epimerase [Clostridia bacterium]
MYLATTTGDFGGYTPLQTESMEYIHQAGFRYLDYNFGSDYARRDGVYSENWKEYLQTVQEKADGLSVKFIQAHSPMGAPIADGNDAFTEDTIRCVEACGILGIPNIVVHSGYTKGLTIRETFDKNKIFYEKLFPMAEKYGVNILVENFNKMCVDGLYWIDNAADQRDLIDYVNHPLFHGCWDAGHGNMQEMTQADSLRILGEHTYALHIQDNMGNDDQHMAPFFGTLNLDSLMHGLLDIGYKGYFTFESGNILLPHSKRRPFAEDTRLLKAPLELRIEAEKFLYAIGKTILSAYGCFEG